jgi:hypothetical protein
VALINTVLFFAAFAIMLYVVQPNTMPGMTGAIACTSIIVGGISHRWTHHALAVLLPSAAVFLIHVTLLAIAMYTVDGGDPEIMWRYVTPDAGEALGAAVVGMSAVVGWRVAKPRVRAAQ